MKQIVMATTNDNKVKRIKALLKDLEYNIVSLKEINENDIEEPNETANTPGDIAIEKASHYAKYLPNNTIVLTQDDTIIFDGNTPFNQTISVDVPMKLSYHNKNTFISFM